MIIVARNNVAALRLFVNGERKADLSSVTRVKVWVRDLEIDSLMNPTLIDWTTRRDDGGDLLLLKLGSVALPVGRHPMRVCWYDPENQLGVEAENNLELTVRHSGDGIEPPVIEWAILDDLLDGTYAKVLADKVLDGKILVSGLEGTLDQLEDGSEYRRVRAAALTVAGLILMDAIENGDYGKIKTSALTADGLVIVSEAKDVKDGTYGLLAGTWIEAGKIKVTGATPFDAVLPESMTAADKTSTIIDGGLITTGGLYLHVDGFVESGKLGYDDDAPGFWIGNDGGTPKLYFGTPAKHVKWTGEDLVLTGKVVSQGNLSGSISTWYGDSTQGFLVAIGRRLTDPATAPGSPTDGDFTASALSWWYSWTGTEWEVRATVGMSNWMEGSYAVINVKGRPNENGVHVVIPGEAGDSRDAIYARNEGGTDTGAGVSGLHLGPGYGVTGTAWDGVGGAFGGEYGVMGSAGASGVGGQARLFSLGDGTAPTHVAPRGTLVDNAAGLYRNNNGSTGWTKVD